MIRKICNEVDEVAPQVLEHFVGNRRQVVNRVTVALEAAWNDGTKLPHMLFIGPPGLGKSLLAHILAKEMGSELYQQLAQNIMCPSDLHAFCLQPKDKEVALLDEIHELVPTAQTTLYRCMENQEIFLEPIGCKKPRVVKTAKFTLLAATTDPHCLLQPLLDRFKLILSFDYYSKDELEILLKNRCKQLNWEAEEQIFLMIAANSRGTPRVGLRLLESVRRTARSMNANLITVEHFNLTCQLEGLDDLGLGSDERKYLRIVSQHTRQNKSVRLNVISSIMGMHYRTISKNIESYLLRIGLITKTDRGRYLTEKGVEYLEKLNTRQ